MAPAVFATTESVERVPVTRGTRWLRAVGRCSYEIYLFHMLVVFGVMALVRAMHPSTRSFPIWYALALAGSVLLGYIIAQTYSEPLNRRLRMASGVVFGKSRASDPQLTAGP
jgi:peptidoglycan/LPS O-acetylase OafA/YrhL